MLMIRCPDALGSRMALDISLSLALSLSAGGVVPLRGGDLEPPYLATTPESSSRGREEGARRRSPAFSGLLWRSLDLSYHIVRTLSSSACICRKVYTHTNMQIDVCICTCTGTSWWLTSSPITATQFRGFACGLHFWEPGVRIFKAETQHFA